MAKGNFEPSLSRVLAHEGGYSNHKDDPGGATNKGVTQRVYDAWRRGRGQAPRSVRQITEAEVAAIYRRQYWDAVRGDDLPAGLDYCVFDYAVNSGPGRAAKDLQRTLGVGVDGIIGTLTLEAAARAAERDEEGVIRDLCQRRYDFVRGLKTWGTFGRGWTRRIMGNTMGAQEGDIGVIDYATMMARNDDTYGAPAPIGSRVGEYAGKADPADVAVSKTPEAVGGGMATVGTSGTVLMDMVPQLTPFADIPAIKWFLVALIVGGVALTFWSVIRRQREGQLA